MPSFPVSIAFLSLFQALLVALPRYRPPFGWMPHSPWWALAPAGSIVVIVFGIEAAPNSAEPLTWLALITVPPLAAFALGWLVRGAVPAWALLAVPLFALAGTAQGSLAGEAAAAALSALACIGIGWLLVSVVPGAWLCWGIYAMAAVDTALVMAQILQGPSDTLSAAAPAGLPRLQVVEFGAARMGFGDVFVAATVGCLLAADRPRQLRAAALAVVLGLSFDLLFFAVDTLPATVPIALALALSDQARLPVTGRGWGRGGKTGPRSAGVADQRDRVDAGEAGDGEGDAEP
jgi:hypothetical protein